MERLSNTKRKSSLLKKVIANNPELSNLEKTSLSTYENMSNRLVFLLSKKYKTAWYWFGFGEAHQEFLKKAKIQGFVLLGCDNPKTKSILIPYPEFKKLLKNMSKTKKDSCQWQIKLYNNGTDAFLKFLKNDMIDISRYLV